MPHTLRCPVQTEGPSFPGALGKDHLLLPQRLLSWPMGFTGAERSTWALGCLQDVRLPPLVFITLWAEPLTLRTQKGCSIMCTVHPGDLTPGGKTF